MPTESVFLTDDEEEGIDAVLSFWFEENGPKQWFTKDVPLDDAIRARFGALQARAVNGELADWRQTARGALAEIIVLDQFPRNLYRDDARAFACDTQALDAAKAALAIGFDQALGETERVFMYLPFEHSEAAEDHKISVKHCAALSDPSCLEWAEKHKAIIDRIGRYPHRNAALGRESTAEEVAFLEEDGSSF